MRRFLLISLVPLLVACSGPSVTTTAPSSVAGPAGVAVTAPKAEAPVVVNPPAEPKVGARTTSSTGSQSSTPASAPSQAKPKVDTAPAPEIRASIGSPAENHGIALGRPIKVGSNVGGLLVTNTTDQVMTFVVRVEYRKGDVVGEMTGTVSDLLPKQSRVANVNAYKLMPADPDSVTVSVVSVKSATPASAKGESAKNIKVGEPKKVENSSSVTVEVTNNDAKAQSVSLKAAYMQGEELVAFGEGQAAGLKPGETRTVTVRPISTMKAHDRVDVTASVI
jgi:hypothetical protein